MRARSSNARTLKYTTFDGVDDNIALAGEDLSLAVGSFFGEAAAQQLQMVQAELSSADPPAASASKRTLLDTLTRQVQSTELDLMMRGLLEKKGRAMLTGRAKLGLLRSPNSSSNLA